MSVVAALIGGPRRTVLWGQVFAIPRKPSDLLMQEGTGHGAQRAECSVLPEQPRLLF